MRNGSARRSLRLAAAVLGLLAFAGAAAFAGDGSKQTRSFDLGGGTFAKHLVFGADGSLWFTWVNGQVSLAGVGRMSPNGEVTEYPLDGQDGSNVIGGIVGAPDGSLWFADPGANDVGRITPAGQIARFPLPAPGAAPGAVALGADGSLWFVEEGLDRVGRLNPEGQLSELSLPSGSRPSGIAAGPEGALWVTEKGSGRIAKVDTGGAITEYRLPRADRLPGEIVGGSDGNLWFTEEAVLKIGRITPAGSVSEFPIPLTRPARAIVAGPGGRIWYGSNVQIGSLSSRGTATLPGCVRDECDLPVNALTVGPEGGLWFATDVRQVLGGGGGGHLTLLGEPGKIGRFFPPTQVRIGPAPGRIRGRHTTLRLRCGGGAEGADCDGSLYLSGRVPRSFSPRDVSEFIPLGGRGFHLAAGSSRRLAVQINRRGLRLLSRIGRLDAYAVASLPVGQDAQRRFALRWP